MVLQRRLEYGFNGYQVPMVPRASRSARGRGAIRKKSEDNQIRAFEILASVAGNLLQESESSAPSSDACVKNQPRIFYNYFKSEQVSEGRLVKEDPCDEKSFACVPGFQGRHKSYTLNEFSHAQENISLKIGSKKYDKSEMIFFPEKLATVDRKNECGCSSRRILGDSPCFGDCFEGKVEGVLGRELEAEPCKIGSEKGGTVLVAGSSEDPMELDREPPALACSESDVKVSLLRDCLNLGSFPRHYANAKLVSRDDDENSIGCTQPSTMLKAYRPPSDTRDRRVKKFSASRHWRVAPKLKDRSYFRTDRKRMPIHCNGRNFHKYERSQKIFPFKKRKFFDQSPLCTSDGEFHHDGIFNCPDKRINGDNSSEAIGASSSEAGEQVPPESKDCNVKLSIKSLKVPELFIEIPATATVGSLKRSVMEAVTAILGDGLHVGILLQGKKVRDDNKTLLQTGISQDQKRHGLGFILEPRRAQIPPPVCTEDPCLLSGATPQGLARRSAHLSLQAGKSYVSPDPPFLNLGSCVESELNVVPSLADTSTGNTMPETQALVAVPAIRMEPLAVVPFHQKSHPEFLQRRIRRPFSVLEVEALVQAVEKLGTGRWRDVKLRAFDCAKHRTYVDLKDKWKTLVHTARISSQQRRGEPVPQDLLDRVLAAHAYWSQHQARQQVKVAE